MDSNREIWNRLYLDGNFLWYPSEILVRLVRQEEKRDGLEGTILDHGSGSGNIAEFLVRSGHAVHCTDISDQSLRLIDRRFRDRGLSAPAMSLIDPAKPLRGQLPRYDHVVAWHSLCYNTPDKQREDINALIAGLPQGGVFIACLKTITDNWGLMSEPLPNGGRVLKAFGQTGAIVSPAKDLQEVVSWCVGLEIRDALTYRIDGKGFHNDEAIVYGAKV